MLLGDSGTCMNNFPRIARESAAAGSRTCPATTPLSHTGDSKAINKFKIYGVMNSNNNSGPMEPYLGILTSEDGYAQKIFRAELT